MYIFLFDLRIHNQVTIQHEFQSSWRQSAAPFCDLAAASSFFAGRFPPFEGSLFRAWRSWSRSSGFNPDVSFLSRVCGSKKGQIIKVNHSIKFTIKLQMQRFIEAVSFASYLYICPFSSGSPPMCGAFDGFGSIPAEKGIWAWQLWQICGVSRENLGYTDTKQDNTTTTCGETTDKIQSVPRANSLMFCEPGC